MAEFSVKSPVLVAISDYVGFVCDEANDAYIKCKSENQSPFHCISQNIAVTECALKVTSLIENTCDLQVEKYTTCLDKHEYHGDFCLSERENLDNCAWPLVKNPNLF
eukprot:TRINITY_DN11276_c0_g1_i1.p1 TRINITY_DN11276_c0_g1~~TRINITY_DN11276_c0_g1_i1.p1  ORF type:complete len:107 (-),score=17.41 TRINITY_DN11276_c0_g1_i1:89-409(-)